jgi:hypothetical protein
MVRLLRGVADVEGRDCRLAPLIDGVDAKGLAAVELRLWLEIELLG